MKEHIHVRPAGDGGYAIDFYDGRGAWSGTVYRLSREAARREADRIRAAMRREVRKVKKDL